MSKELRVLAIVFASLAGLVVLGFVALAIAFGVFVKHIASAPRDPAALLRTAHKIANFDVPPGYEIASATDLGFSLNATLRPIGRHSAFRIELQGSAIPTSGDSQANGTALGMALAERLLGCTPGPARTVDVLLRHARKPMRVTRCTTKSGESTQVDFITFSGNVPTVSLSAVGSGGDFDEPAVRALLASLK
jgi:hypothetical protein